MSDRYFAFTVNLLKEISKEDAQPTIEAIRMIKGVQSVKPHVSNWDHYAAIQTASLALRRKIFEALDPEKYKSLKELEDICNE